MWGRYVPAVSSIFEFGPFRLDEAERLLLRAGQPVALTPKAFDLLLYLVGRHGRLVTKQELMRALWADTFVEEANLTYTMSALRKVLGDGHNGEQFIQTVPTRGYRFVMPVTHPDDQPVSLTSEALARSLQTRVRRVASIGLAGAAVAMLLVVVVGHLRETTEHPAAATFTISLPDSALATTSIPMSQISPDGRRVALIVAPGSRIWIRNIEGQLAAVPIAGTEGAVVLFWAPDSQQLAFSTRSALKTLRVSDGTVDTLWHTPQPTRGGTWSRNGTIVVTTLEGPLLGIQAAGGKPRAVTTLDRSRGEISHLYPCFLPDGIRFLYVSRSADAARSGLYIGRIGSAERRLLLGGDLPAIYAAPGYLLFLRAGTLMAQRLDPGRMQFSGEARPLVAASGNSLVGQPAFSASATGVLTYSIVERPLAQFQWVGRVGQRQQLVGEPGAYYTFDLSADASRLTFARVESGSASLWVRDLDRGVTSRLTFGPSFHADPRWTADRQRIVATKWQPLPQAIVEIAPDGTESSLPTSGIANMVEDVSPDGRYLLYRQGGQRLLAMSLRDESEPVVVRSARVGTMNQAQFSPDGRWVAYHSDESGRFEVYVTPFSPAAAERWQVSSGGGVQPVWRQDGRELYYLGLDGTLNAVKVRTGTGAQFSAPDQLFDTGLVPNENVEQYAAAGDGQRFLVLKPIAHKVPSSIGVVLNWPAMLHVPR